MGRKNTRRREKIEGLSFHSRLKTVTAVTPLGSVTAVTVCTSRSRDLFTGWVFLYRTPVFSIAEAPNEKRRPVRVRRLVLERTVRQRRDRRAVTRRESSSRKTSRPSAWPVTTSLSAISSNAWACANSSSALMALAKRRRPLAAL